MPKVGTILWHGKFLDGKLAVVSMESDDPAWYKIFFQITGTDTSYHSHAYIQNCSTACIAKLLEGIEEDYLAALVESRDAETIIH